MKRIANILSYLCLLLLLLVAACSDLEEIVVNMQGEEEVELTIQTNIPSLGGSTRTAPTENITSITALAFDSDHELVKVVKATLYRDETNGENNSTVGTMTIKVPVRTRRIHFIAKNNGTFGTFSTETDYGKGENELLQDLTTKELHYWAKLDFEDAEDMEILTDELAETPNKEGKLTLIRNMAKLVLDTDSNDDYIAGLLNYNVKGTIVPYKDGVLGYQTATNHDLPTDFEIAKDEEDKSLGKEHYMFEEFNDNIDGNTDLVYAICNIDDKFYKIAFKSGDSYYYIIRNQVYTIKIAGTLDDKLGKDTYADAVQNGSPINDTTKEQVHIEFEPDGETTFAITDNEVSMYLRETGKVKVIIPEGITELQIGYSTENFNAGGLSVKTTDGEAVSTTKATETRENIYIDTYDVTNLREIELSISLKESITDAINDMQIQFIGSGELKQSNDKLIVDVLKRDDLTVTPTTVQLKKSAGSEFTVSVTMPSFDNFTGNFELQVTDVNDKFTISPEPQEGKYTVEEGSTTTFTFTLEADGNVDDVYTINFDAISDFHHLTGTTTVTLIDDAVPDQDVYEIWVGDGNAWTGTTNSNSVEFFGYKTTADSNGFEKNTTPPTGFRTTFYDALTVNSTTYSADNHKQQAMVMGSDDSFTFTIPEGSNRWLTLLVANDGDDSDTPSIQLSNGSDWTTAGNTVDLTNGTYNFGAKGEITTAGRLIRYELPAGTYTLKGSDADYLLYYMRVSKARPEMTDVAQPQLADYNLSWSGGDYAKTTGKGYLKISDSKHIVDEDNLTHTVSLIDGNSLTISGGESTFDLTVATTRVTFSSTDSNEYGSSTIYQYPEIINGSFALQTYNAGNYTLKGTIEKPNYKYSAFYDKLLLDAVQYEVKSPIMPGLYTSMDGDKLTPVNGFTNLDEAWAIGFLMPKVVPISASELLPYDANNPKYKNYTIDINIPNWTLSDEGDARGLGVIEKSTYNYTLGTQENNNSQEMIHPREGWTYKIKWASIHDTKKIVPTLTGDKGDETKDTDHYFTYKGTIAKEVEIETPYTVTQLNIESLEFRSASENGNGKTYNLNFGSDFYLKATITPEDANNYAGKTVRLNGSFSNLQNGGNNAVHWYNSRKESSIGYAKNDGTALQFKVEAGKTEYEIHWQFERSNSDTGEVRFTYTVGNNEFTGSNSATATIVLNGNSQAVDNPLDIALDFYVDNADEGSGQYTNSNLQFGVTNLYLKVTIPENVPAGTRIELDMETGGNKGWINEWQSWDETRSSDVSYRYQEGVTGLVLTAKAGIRDYLMCWTFVRSDNNVTSDVNISYALSSTLHTLSGETSANLTIKGNNKQIQVSAHDRAAAGKITVPLAYGTGTTEEFTVDVTVPAGVTGISIAAEDFYVAWSNGNGAVSNSTTYTFAESQETQTKRFKFTLKEESKGTKETSTITFSCNDKYVANGTVVVDLSQRSAETVPAGGTTIWSGLAQLEWSVNYLSIPNTIAKGSTVRINFAQNSGTFKLHDGSGSAFKLGKEANNYPQNDSYLGISQNYYEFEVNDITSGTNITKGLQGLKINGDNVTVTSVVVYGGSTSNESVVYEVDFRNVKEWNLWCDPQDHAPTFDSENGFHLSNPQQLNNTWQPQYHLAYGLALEAGTYKLTMRIRGDNAEGFDTKQLNIGLSCWTEGDSRPYTTMSFSDSWSDVSVNVTLSQNTTNSGADTDGFVMCQSGSFIGDLYIQWLRIEKTSQ